MQYAIYLENMKPIEQKIGQKIEYTDFLKFNLLFNLKIFYVV